MTIKSSIENISVDLGLDPETSSDWESTQIRRFIGYSGEFIANYAPWERMKKSWYVPGSCLPFKYPAEHRVAQPADVRRILTVRLNTDDSTSRLIPDSKTWAAMVRRPPVQFYHHIDQGDLCILPGLDAGGAVVTYAGLSWLESGDFYSPLSDNDSFLFPEKVVELGAVWRWKRQKGLEFQSHKDEFEEVLALAIQHDHGGG